jgi:uncharacterized membrane protein
MEKNNNLTEDILQTNTLHQTENKSKKRDKFIDASMLVAIAIIGLLSKFIMPDIVSLFLCAIALIWVGLLWVFLIYKK